MRNVAVAVGGQSIRLLELLGGLSQLTYDTVYCAFTPPFNPRELIRQVDHIGVKSISIAGVAAAFTGLVLALQTAYGLSRFGAKAYVGIIVSLSMGMGFIALSEGYLSFLGIGLQPPNPSWGNIMAENAGRYWRRYPEMVWLVFIPGALFALIVLAFSFLGDGLNEALNPEID